MWSFITDFGDTAVTVPLATAVLAILAIRRQRRLALGWAGTVAATAAMIGALKVALAICAACFAFRGIRSPSGHTAMSAAVYLSLALLVARELPKWLRWTLLAGAAALVLAIAQSRLSLRLHTPLEVAIGLAIGIAAVVGFRAMLRAAPAGRTPIAWLGGAAVLPMALLHGMRWPAEQAVHGSAGLLQRILPWCG